MCVYFLTEQSITDSHEICLLLPRGPLWDKGCWGGAAIPLPVGKSPNSFQVLHHPALSSHKGSYSPHVSSHHPKLLTGPTLLSPLLAFTSILPSSTKASSSSSQSRTLPSLGPSSDVSPSPAAPKPRLTPQAFMEMSGPYSENNCAALGVACAGPSVSPGGIYVLTSSQTIIPGLRDQGDAH